MGLHVIVGAGLLGTSTASQLAEDGHRVRLVSRSGRGPRHPNVELRRVDAADAAALRAATADADIIYNTVNPPYHQWLTDWPPIASSILAAAEAASADLVTVSNLYIYGTPDGPMTEDSPLASTLPKARVRIRMWEDALAAHQAGRVRVTELRPSDYFGPGATENSHLGERVVPRLLDGQALWVMGSPNQPHTWTYVPDIARALVIMGTDERALGRAWHVPSNPPMTQREVAQRMTGLAGVATPAVRGTPRWVMQAAGRFNPLMGEIAKIWYQFAEPFVMDSSAFTRTFGMAATPMDEALRATLEYWRDRRRAAA